MLDKNRTTISLHRDRNHVYHFLAEELLNIVPS